MPNKCMLILLDGLGDRAYDRLQNRTPLEAARTPCLDHMAAMGGCGLYHATRQGQALPSEEAHFAIFGYAPDEFPGRGPLEAMGAGIALSGDDIAVLSHFASLEQKGRTLVLRNGKLVMGPEALRDMTQLVNDLGRGDIRIRFHPTHKAYGIITLTGRVSPCFTDTDPVTKGMPLIEPEPLAGYEQDEVAVQSAAALKAFLVKAHQVLEPHPLNRAREQKGLDTADGLVTQRAGRLKQVPAFESRWGLKGLSMASGLVYGGLSRCIGIDFIKVADSADPGGDLARRVTEAHRALADYDLIHVHTKVPDEAGHLKDPEKKKEAIEALDAGLARAIPPVMDDPEVLVVVASDHSTPSAGPLIHSGESVPLLFCGPGIRKDHVCVFDEVSVSRGALGPVRGREMMLMILNALDRAKLQGLRDTPRDQPYWPGRRRTFKVD